MIVLSQFCQFNIQLFFLSLSSLSPWPGTFSSCSYSSSSLWSSRSWRNERILDRCMWVHARAKAEFYIVKHTQCTQVCIVNVLCYWLIYQSKTIHLTRLSKFRNPICSPEVEYFYVKFKSTGSETHQLMNGILNGTEPISNDTDCVVLHKVLRPLPCF